MVVIKVFIRSVKQVIRSPAQLALILAFPLIFVASFAFIFGGGTEFLGSTTLEIGVLNKDQIEPNWKNEFGPYIVSDTKEIFEKGFGEYFVTSLEGSTSINITGSPLKVHDYSSLDKATNDIKSRKIVLCLIIPRTFSHSILSGLNYKINLTEGASVDSQLANINTSIKIQGDSGYQTYQQLQTEISDALQKFIDYFYGIDFIGGQFAIQTEDVTSIAFTSFDYYIPGFLIFGVILGSASIGFIVGTERSHGTLDRLRISKLNPIEYLTGLSASQILILSCQVAVMLVAAYIFGFQGKGNPIYSFFFGVLATIPAMGLGLTIAAIDKTGENASGIAAFLSAPLGFLSGAFLPLPEVVLIPDFLPTSIGETRALLLWDLNPFSQIVRAQNLILLSGHDISQLQTEIIFTLVGGVLIFLIGASLFTLRVFKD
ncbi:MAG: ABC transporter permease [Candidatus Heimdallarchaeota archaeon]|nr:MAG: ABC transporter permease [Candidatus Heimdallarchaeota archaeon]